jgi:hypothetical protein
MYYLSRAVYEALFLAAAGESAKDSAAYVKSQYPTTTAGAATELRTRGLDANPGVLGYLVETEKVPQPASGLRGFAWTPGDIDRAAAVLDGEARRTPWGFFLELFDLDADQVATARHEALHSRPGAAEGDFGIVILPGIPGQGVPAVIRYLPRERAMILSKGA